MSNPMRLPPLAATVLTLCLAAATAPANLLRGTDFKHLGDDADPWEIGTTGGATASAAVDPAAPADHPAVVLDVTKVTGTDWHVQFFHPKVKVTKGTKYRLTFTGHGSAPRTINVFLQQAHDGYGMVSDTGSVSLTTTPTPASVDLTATADDANAKLTLIVGQSVGTITLADVSLVDAGK